MLDMDVTQELLFQQLGLDSSKEGIEKFIDTHRFDLNTAMPAAGFWTDSQRTILISHWGNDDEWSMVIDQLNEQLHDD